MNNKGFVFIETIITVVVLTSTLVALYAAYSNVIITEKSRLYHDDIAYVYKTEHIRDILAETIDQAKFTDAVNHKTIEAGNSEIMHMYVFNVESDIYLDKKTISQAKDLYNIYRLVYIKIEDIADIKSCVKNGMVNDPSNKNEYKCNNTLWFAESHGFSYLKDYILTLDVDASASSAEGILISMLYETKNGGAQQTSTGVVTVGKGKYSECLYEKVRIANSISPSASNYENRMIEAMQNYNDNDNLSFNMSF